MISEANTLPDRDRLILDHLPLARRCASRKQYHSPSVSYDDLFQAACIGLTKAADTWQPGPAPFAIWAKVKIRAEIGEELKRMLHRVRVPRGERPLCWKPLDEDVEQDSQEPHVDLIDKVENLLSRLSEQTRTMMSLHFGLGDGEEWTGTRIATSLGCSHTTVQNRIKQGIGLIRANS